MMKGRGRRMFREEPERKGANGREADKENC